MEKSREERQKGNEERQEKKEVRKVRVGKRMAGSCLEKWCDSGERDWARGAGPIAHRSLSTISVFR